jgi:transaldolase
VIEAFFSGLERRVKQGRPVEQLRSVASFFVSRVDSKVDPELDRQGDPRGLRGTAAIANACRAYALFQRQFSGARWDALAGKGARVQRPLWASTSVKDKAYSDLLYADALIGPDTVDTMPRETIDAFQDHGEVELTLEQGIDEAHRVFEQIAEAGVDYDDVTDTLEREGVQKFIDSFTELLEGIDAKRKQLVAA